MSHESESRIGGRQGELNTSRPKRANLGRGISNSCISIRRRNSRCEPRAVPGGSAPRSIGSGSGNLGLGLTNLRRGASGHSPWACGRYRRKSSSRTTTQISEPVWEFAVSSQRSMNLLPQGTSRMFTPVASPPARAGPGRSSEPSTYRN